MKKQSKYGFSIGDEVIPIKEASVNYRKKGKVIGFHATYPYVYVDYGNGNIGHSTNEGDGYVKVSDLLS